MGSQKSRTEGQSHLPRPAGHAAFDAAQDMVGFLGCKCTLLACVELINIITEYCILKYLICLGK